MTVVVDLTDRHSNSIHGGLVKPTFNVSAALFETDIEASEDTTGSQNVQTEYEASNQSQHPASATLLDLPYEIRALIYNQLFANSKISFHSSWPCNSLICTCSFAHAITRTSRQLRAETLPRLLPATTIEVFSTFDSLEPMPESYLREITRATVLNTKRFKQPYRFELLPSLCILELRDVTVWCKFYDEVFLESDAADEAMVRLACFNVQRMAKDLGDLLRSQRSFAVHLCCQFVMNSLSDETIHATIDVDRRTVVHKKRGPPMKNYHSWSGFY